MRVLIIGAGEVGYHTALRLSRENHRVVLVDQDPEKIKTVNEQMDVQTLVGKGSSPAALLAAGVREAELVVAVTDSDEVNMTACRFAQALAPAVTKVARIRSMAYLHFFEEHDSRQFGVDLVINPEREVANQIMQLIYVPAANSVADFAGGKVKLLGLRAPVTSPILRRPLHELRMSEGSRFLVAAIERDGEVIIPRGDDHLRADDRAYVVVREDMINEVMEFFSLRNEPVRKLVVVGGGAIGRLVAERAQRRDIKARVIEKDEDRCQMLVDQLDDVIVLHGDGTDMSLLREENIGAADVFAAVTDDEEDNVLIALMGKKMGARRTVARVAHMGYVPLVSSLGIDLVVSPRFAAVGAILRYLRRGKVLAVSALRDEGAEVIEVEAQATSAVVGKPLAQVKMPSGALVAAVVRGEEVEIPNGQTVINPGDRMVIFMLTKVLSKVEKLLTVSLEYF